MISVVITTFNRAALLDRAINSVLNQSYDDWELVIVDNSSSDNTDQIVKKYTSNKIKMIKVNNNGIIALSAGHDGVLLYRHYQNFDDENDLLGPISFVGQINTPYSNNVKVDGDNLIISTEDGIYLYLIK